jgi:hypothetical protein
MPAHGYFSGTETAFGGTRYPSATASSSGYASVGTPSSRWNKLYVLRSTSSLGVAVSPTSSESKWLKIARYCWYTERCASSMTTRSK